jgi:hypothetical protein
MSAGSGLASTDGGRAADEAGERRTQGGVTPMQPSSAGCRANATLASRARPTRYAPGTSTAQRACNLPAHMSTRITPESKDSLRDHEGRATRSLKGRKNTQLSAYHRHNLVNQGIVRGGRHPSHGDSSAYSYNL